LLHVLLPTIALVACSGASTDTTITSSDGGEEGQDGGSNVDASNADGSVGSVTGGGNHDGGADAAHVEDSSAPQDAGDAGSVHVCNPAASPTVDTCVLTNAIGIFASSSLGSDATGDGTMAAPYATAGQAISVAKAKGKRVFLCAEPYSEAISFVSGVSVFGGLDCSQPAWTVAATRAHFAPAQSPAAVATGISVPTVVEAVEIFAPDAVTPSGSSVALAATSAAQLSLVNVWLQAGNAADGTAGTEGVGNVEGNGANGANGGNEITCATLMECAVNQGGSNARRAGGTSTCGGGAGGSGGNRGAFQSLQCASNLCVMVYPSGFYWNQTQAPGTGVKLNGLAGSAGVSGKSATAGLFNINGWVPGNGTNGTSGGAGTGGSGGDGQSLDFDPTSVNPPYALGNWGAGGGAGGCAGIAGTAGTGGGASVALLAVGSPLSIVSSMLTSSNGGAGKPGTLGAPATPGGAAGTTFAPKPLTAGAHGGAGGESGISGSGAGGPSVAIAYTGNIPVVDAKSTLTPGTAGLGVTAQSSNGKTIPASGNGVSQATFSF
jgi:hypothetical protein